MSLPPLLPRFCIALAAMIVLCADTFVSDDVVTDPTPAHFSVCHGFGCAVVSQVALDTEMWGSIRRIFHERPSSAEAEREHIATAIARFEAIVGEIVGTSEDLGENRTRGRLDHRLDCIDESTNTTTYLRILEHEGLLHWHRPSDRVTRGWLIFGWPHTTAVIVEKATGDRWAVDSWFFDNGVPPAVAPLEIWRGFRWHPDHPGLYSKSTARSNS